jgi:hypothetical protein
MKAETSSRAGLVLSATIKFQRHLRSRKLAGDAHDWVILPIGSGCSTVPAMPS